MLLPSTAIITGYNPVKHLKLLGFTDKYFEENSLTTDLFFENVVTVFDPKASLILVCLIVETEKAEGIYIELQKVNSILKVVYAAAYKNRLQRKPPSKYY